MNNVTRRRASTSAPSSCLAILARTFNLLQPPIFLCATYHHSLRQFLKRQHYSKKYRVILWLPSLVSLKRRGRVKKEKEMAWRAALNSIPANLLSGQQKGELIALITVKHAYKPEDLDAAITGLDVEALSGFFRCLLPAAASTSAGEETLLDKVLKGQIALAKEVKNLRLGVSASIWLTLWGDIVSSTTSETTRNFRKALVTFYGDDTDKKNVSQRPEASLRCMVTDLKLPGTWITAAHLLARKHATKSHIFGIDDIDDPRNGLLWNRVVEEKFSTFEMVFSWCQEENTFITHVINKDLIEENMRDANLRKPLNRSQDFFMDAAIKERFDVLKFGDLEGKHMQFNNMNRPFKRVLCAHAKLGLWKAKQEEKLPPDFDPWKYNFEYCSDSPDSLLFKKFLIDSQTWMGNKENEDGSLDFVLKDLLNLEDGKEDSLGSLEV